MLGDRAGGVMMEYVILAVLIVAAVVVVAVAMFGKTIAGMFDTVGKGATTRHTEAKATLDKTRNTQDADAKAAEQYHGSMRELDFCMMCECFANVKSSSGGS
ncbi:MAG: hypothetical protein WC340_10635 [Kiritimatiellia bacterium]